MTAAVVRLAWRHLAARPRQAALTVAGVAVGVAVFIFTVAMMDGLVVFFTRRLIGVSPLVTVLTENLEVPAARAALERGAPGEVLQLSRPPVPDERPTVRGAVAMAPLLRQLPGVEGVAVAARTPVVLSFGTIAEPASLQGTIPGDERTVTELWNAVLEGSWDALEARRDGVIPGVQLARRLGVEVGDRVVAVGETGAALELEVVGVLATGLGAYDEATAVVNLPVAQALAGWGADEASEIRIRTAALTGLDGVRRQVEALTGHRAETWDEANRASLQLFRTIGTTTYLLTGFVLVVAGLGIGNKLTTIILDKERDIAILRACGFSRPALRGVFLLEGLMLGGSGALAGCLLAALGIAYFQAFPIRFAPREGSVLAYTELFLANDPRYYAVVSGVALAIAALAALVAVRKAVRVLPVEVLRGAA
ncbi:MAG TPA: ABC transporter permease [Thermoanaerobaculaceae bacterium]|nr:ABC transporter permease [Thermoanaerobaculaceae bacterium]HRS17136.1 ABC transporter permease [Thermoanaerobaculaceae bacterium]